MEEWLSTVKVSFYMTGDKFDTNVVTNELNINPTQTRQKEDFPKVSKRMGFACTGWELDTKHEVSRTVSSVMDILIKQLSGKEGIIVELCEKYNLETSFTIVINTKDDDMPEMVLTRNNIKFISLINAEVGFDIYRN